ncbi:hypothetical protein ISCGN_030329 [Ixodes scapularis]
MGKPRPLNSDYDAWNASTTGVFTAAKTKRVPRFSPDDVAEASHCRRRRSWRRPNSGDVCGRRLFCCGSLSSSTDLGSFGSQELGRRDDSDTRVCLCFLTGTPIRPAVEMATS